MTTFLQLIQILNFFVKIAFLFGYYRSLGLEGEWKSGLRVGLGYRYDDNAAEASYLGLNVSYGL